MSNTHQNKSKRMSQARKIDSEKRGSSTAGDIRGQKLSLHEKKELRQKRKELLFVDEDIPPRIKPALKRNSAYIDFKYETEQGNNLPKKKWNQDKLKKMMIRDPHKEKDHSDSNKSSESIELSHRFQAKKKDSYHSDSSCNFFSL